MTTLTDHKIARYKKAVKRIVKLHLGVEVEDFSIRINDAKVRRIEVNIFRFGYWSASKPSELGSSLAEAVSRHGSPQALAEHIRGLRQYINVHWDQLAAGVTKEEYEADI